MARVPADRFGNCGDFATALREALGRESGPKSVPPVSRPPTEIAMPAVAPAPPPTEIAAVSGLRSTRPGLTEPSLPVTPGDFPPRPQDMAPRGAGTVVAPVPRPSWWRSRTVLAAAAAVVVLGAAGAVFAALHHGSTTSGTSGGGGHGTTPLAGAVAAPPCSTQAATPKQLTGVRTGTTGVGGSPFGIAVTPDGKYSFVSTGNAVTVLNNHNGSLAPTRVATIPARGAQKTVTITPDGKYVLAAASNGAYVISATGAENGDAAIQGSIFPPLDDTSNEVFVSRNGLLFITYQNTGNVAVFNLQQEIAGGFGQTGFLGTIPLGPKSEPQAMAESPNGRWLYVTGESRAGRLYLVDLAKAGTDPQHALVSSAPAGCAPARVIVSPDGQYVWVTDRDSNALVAFSAARLLAKSPQPLVTKVTVGRKPIGLSFVNGGNEIMVADANSDGPPGADNLVLVSTQLALQHNNSDALSGFIPTGQQPRDLALEPGGKTLLSTDTKSGHLLAIDVRSLP
jgi:DNA-binding beta-propeller fold protein YncE